MSTSLRSLRIIISACDAMRRTGLVLEGRQSAPGFVSQGADAATVPRIDVTGGGQRVSNSKLLLESVNPRQLYGLPFSGVLGGSECLFVSTMTMPGNGKRFAQHGQGVRLPGHLSLSKWYSALGACLARDPTGETRGLYSAAAQSTALNAY
jgi:hypothetical protein